jgi:hypothetical protein
MKLKFNISLRVAPLLLIAFLNAPAAAQVSFKGKVYDKSTDEILIGAAIILKGTNYYTISGLDGSYNISNIPAGTYNMEVSYISYETLNETIALSSNITHDIRLSPSALSIGAVEVIAVSRSNTETGAREIERSSVQSLNAISAAAIELSPDLTVANVVQRVSGLTVERGNSGDAQYAIVRGMEKRYNYTLVNGIKIPSPDNENRYVPLDIFPAELLDRLVVSKSLTPSMEGDAIGGVVDMKMKSAHSKNMLSANVSTGYSEIFTKRRYDYYNYKVVDNEPPMQRIKEGDRVAGDKSYYTTDNFNFHKKQPLPNYNLSLTLGSRFLNNRLGVLVAGTHQSSHRGTDRTQFVISDTRGGSNMPFISRFQERRYSITQQRTGVHSKIDFILSPRHSFSLYNVWLNLKKNETRVTWEDGLRALNYPTLENNFRTQNNTQRIYNTTLQGEHTLSSKLSADWSLAYAVATQNMPDNSQLITVSNYDTPDRSLRWLVHENQIRIWESNSDKDYAVYHNFAYKPFTGYSKFEIKTGGLYRMKNRENSFDLYSFKPNPGIQEYVPYHTDYAGITWRITGAAGTPTHALNYKSDENIFAHYLQVSFPLKRFSFVTGARFEHTDQGFSTANNLVEDGSQVYWHILPSVHSKILLTENSHIRASYFKSVSRPSFLEIIPYTRPSTEDIYVSGGNPSLKPVVAHNFDLRYELFPSNADQVLAGAFYKHINNPIEVAVMNQTDENYQPHFPSNLTVITSINYQTAINQGLELDIIKYFNKIGFRANYTFTLSQLESIKRTYTEVTADNLNQLTDLQKQTIGIGDSTYLNLVQKRPLQGQSRHLGNLSLLFKDQKRGWDAQLSAVYTGERIAVVSTGFETDWWQKPMVQLDLSIEKKLSNSFTTFLKINNIIDTPYEMYIKKPHFPSARIKDKQPNGDKETLVRSEKYGRIFLIGLKYRL